MFPVATPWVVIALAVASAVAWGFAGRRPDRGAARPGTDASIERKMRIRRGRRAVLAVVATVVSIAAVADTINVYFSYYPTATDVVQAATGEQWHPTFDAVNASDTRHPGGVVVRLRIPDRGSGFGASDALVWLPPQYFDEPTTHFPVVYLFHGSPGVPSDWFQGGQAPSAALTLARAGRPAIIVAPRMSHGWLDDPECVDGVQEKVESHFVEDVVPTVDAQLRTLADRSDRVLGGMSAGGYCALNLGLRHRDLAATIVDMSGLTQPTHTGGDQALFGSDPDVVARDVAATSPAVYAPTLPAGPPMRVWLDVGLDDHESRGPIEAIAPVLQSRGLTVELHERPGAHTFHVWAPALRESLPWALSSHPVSTT